ncbi:MAG: hypothetical protein V1913_03085 [Fibrobacterota bacterium]
MTKFFILFSILLVSSCFSLNPDGKVRGIGVHAFPSLTKYNNEGSSYGWYYWYPKTQSGFNGSYSATAPISDYFTGAFTYKMQRIENQSILHSFVLSSSIYFKSDSIFENPDGKIGYPIVSPVIGMNAFVGRKGLIAGTSIDLPIFPIMTVSVDYLLNRLSDESNHSIGGGFNLHLLNHGITSSKSNPDGSPGSINLQIRSHFIKPSSDKGMDFISVLQIPTPFEPLTFNASYQLLRSA